ncbi:unnamed protein product [Closterium sp. NIES-53]
MAPGQQASAEGMAVEGAENEGEADLAETTSMEAAGVADMAATTRAMDAVAADSTAKRIEEQEEGEEEAVEAVAVAEVVLQI